MFHDLGSRPIRAAASALWLAATAGCWDAAPPPVRMSVDGMVILDRRPLESGAIQFRLEAEHPGKDFEVGATIRDGRFELPADEGLLPGLYKVAIYSAATVPSPKDGPATARLLPDRYNTATILKAEIKPTWPNSLTFVLER